MTHDYDVVWTGARGSASLCSDFLTNSSLTACAEEKESETRVSARISRRHVRQSTLDAAKREIRERHGA
jgi:hypothetical protein